MNININIKKYAIEAASKLLISSHLWKTVKKLCIDAANDANLDNAAKQAAVKADLKIIFSDTASIVLNLAIELGALYVNIVFPQFAAIANAAAAALKDEPSK